eukprot:CAMPEP_0168465248 /NCGR_PEP_ID=MMETSP0228-20121227/56011_1 /TAXON_ID=133427 /ORGANISM="Protoceratium reticulatum, Strain CCCM 535 (=CCMP 1889)" /LENGTH=140 /DNA_ID=CAMNT_0008480805 /DNA_START=1 /DNA_END=419 /DNA_ORIENTATION=+
MAAQAAAVARLPAGVHVEDQGQEARVAAEGAVQARPALCLEGAAGREFVVEVRKVPRAPAVVGRQHRARRDPQRDPGALGLDLQVQQPRETRQAVDSRSEAQQAPPPAAVFGDEKDPVATLALLGVLEGPALEEPLCVRA